MAETAASVEIPYALPVGSSAGVPRVGAVTAEVGTTTRTRDELMLEICGHIGNGQSVRLALKKVKGPAKTTFWRWLAESEDNQRLYETALKAKAERGAEQIMDIADEPPPMVQHANGEHMDATFVAWQKNRIEARKWIASKMLPKKYGDKLGLEHGVSDDFADQLVKARQRASG